MNILLLNPPAPGGLKIVREGRCMQRLEAWGTSWPPLTLALMAAILRERGFTVRIIDGPVGGYAFNQLAEEIKIFKPHLLVVNTATPSITSDLKIAGLTKEINPAIKTIFFGIHVTALPRETFSENSEVEFLAVGEPEDTVRDFALAVKNNETFEKIPGLAWRKNGEIIFNGPRPLMENLDELPPPAWDLIDVKKYCVPIKGNPFLLVLISRGCPYSCNFCAARIFYGSRARLRSPEKIVSEIKYFKEKFGVRDYLFWAENSTASQKQLYEISQRLIADEVGVSWVCNGRVDLVDEDLLKMMKKAGCWMIGFGVESGSQKILDLMQKKIKLTDIVQAVTFARKTGLEVTAHVIIGYPGETRTDVGQTLKFLKKLDPDYLQVYCAVPFPGSPLFEQARKNKWLVTADWSRYEQNYSVIRTEQLSEREVMKLRKKMILNFYLRPGKILKTILKIKNPLNFFKLFFWAKDYFILWANG